LVLLVLAGSLVLFKLLLVRLFRGGSLLVILFLGRLADVRPHLADRGEDLGHRVFGIVLHDLRAHGVHEDHVSGERPLGRVGVLLEFLLGLLQLPLRDGLLVLCVVRGLLVLSHGDRVLRLPLVGFRDVARLVAVGELLPHFAKLLGDLDHRKVGVVVQDVPAFLAGPEEVGRQASFGRIWILRCHFLCF